MEPGEVVLWGGVANAGRVTRIGPHVLRPAGEHSPTIHRFLAALRAGGFDAAPLPVGMEADGRERLTYLEGQVPIPPYPAWAQEDGALASIARLLREFHEHSRRWEPPVGAWSTEMVDPQGGTVVCHNDLCLENVVFAGGRAAGLLDFDFCAPGRPVFDVAQFARMCVPIDDELSASLLGWAPADRPGRLRVVADAYGLGRAERGAFVEALDRSIATGGAFVQRRVEAGDPNFIAMWNAMGGRERFDRRRRWWAEQRHRFHQALH